MVDDLSFYVNKDGKSIKCDIVSLIPDGDDTTYVAFTDYQVDSLGKPYLQYAKITKKSSDYVIEEFDDPAIVSKLLEKIFDDLSKYALDKVR